MEQAPDNGLPDIVFVDGAPAVGKTSLAHPLAARLGMDLTHVDDFYMVLERMTDAERYPPIHQWRIDPEGVLALDDAGMIEHTRSVSAIVAEAIAPVLADRLEYGIRSVFEGDFVQPAFAASVAFDGVAVNGRVRSVFLFETFDGFAENIAAREGEQQPRRAEISWRYSEWLRAECEAHGLPAIDARPWDTVLERALAEITSHSGTEAEPHSRH